MRVLKKGFSHIDIYIYMNMNVGTTTNDGDICLIDSATTHTILKSNKFFSCLVMQEVNISAISSTTNIIGDSGRAIVLLQRGTILHIKMHFILLSLIKTY